MCPEEETRIANGYIIMVILKIVIFFIFNKISVHMWSDL